MLPTQTPWKKLLLRLGSNSHSHPGGPGLTGAMAGPGCPLGLMTQVVGCFASIWDKRPIVHIPPSPQKMQPETARKQDRPRAILSLRSQLARLSAWLPHERRGVTALCSACTSEWGGGRGQESVGRAPIAGLKRSLGSSASQGKGEQVLGTV